MTLVWIAIGTVVWGFAIGFTVGLCRTAARNDEMEG